MKDRGFSNFTMHKHTELWKMNDAKNPKFKFGDLVADKHWYWYKNWLDFVEKHCVENIESYT